VKKGIRALNPALGIAAYVFVRDFLLPLLALTNFLLVPGFALLRFVLVISVGLIFYLLYGL
jgi:hypothetical protein